MIHVTAFSPSSFQLLIDSFLSSLEENLSILLITIIYYLEDNSNRHYVPIVLGIVQPYKKKNRPYKAKQALEEIAPCNWRKLSYRQQVIEQQKATQTRNIRMRRGNTILWGVIFHLFWPAPLKQLPTITYGFVAELRTERRSPRKVH